MSVSLIYVSPANAEEKSYNLPLLTEALFNSIVAPLAEALGAQWIPLLQSGIDLTAADAPDVIREVRQLVETLPADTPTRVHVRERLTRLCSELERIFATRTDAVVFVG